MYSVSDLREGVYVTLSNTPYKVISYEHSKRGRGGAMARTKLKNLKDGSVISKTFKGSDSIQAADIQHQEVSFLYEDKDSYYFMNQETYEQLPVHKDVLGDAVDFIAEDTEVKAVVFDGKPINIELPHAVHLEVAYTEPGVKGDTVSNTLKPATLSTGKKVKVPLFIEKGDVIKVSTETGEYLERKS